MRALGYFSPVNSSDGWRNTALTLAGGGNRAFYQLGLLQSWWERLAPSLGVISSCSAGTCTAVLMLTGRHESTFEFWRTRRSHVTKNLEWWKLLRGERPAPHFPIYRDTMVHALSGGGLERIQALPFPVFSLVATPPHGLPVPLAIPIGLGAYSLERWLHPGRLHPGIGRRLGFAPIAVDLRTCPSVEAAADLVLASSATPPFTPVGHVGGQAVLDGGLVDNAPAFVADEAGPWARHLVVLTRPYPAEVMGERGARWYLCPSEPPAADRWDYTNPERIDQTIALGRRDADRHAAQFVAWLGRGAAGAAGDRPS